jgi:hypothetical protein
MYIIRTEFTLFLGIAAETNKDGEDAKPQIPQAKNLGWLEKAEK